MTDQEFVEMYIAITPGRKTSQEILNKFIDRWKDKILQIIAYCHYRKQDHEELYQKIMESWIRQDMISQYDPTVANFSTYLYNYVSSHALNFRYKFHRDYDRFESLDKAQLSVEGPEPELNLDHIHSILNPDQSELFRILQQQVQEDGDKNVNMISSMRGLSVRAIYYQINAIRNTLTEVGFVQRDAQDYPVWSECLT